MKYKIKFLSESPSYVQSYNEWFRDSATEVLEVFKTFETEQCGSTVLTWGAYDEEDNEIEVEELQKLAKDEELDEYITFPASRNNYELLKSAIKELFDSFEGATCIETRLLASLFKYLEEQKYKVEDGPT